MSKRTHELKPQKTDTTSKKWSVETWIAFVGSVAGVIAVLVAVLTWKYPPSEPPKTPTTNPPPPILPSEQGRYDVEVPAKGKVRLTLYTDKGVGACMMTELDTFPYRPPGIKIGTQDIHLTWKQNTGPNATTEPFITEPFKNIIPRLPDRELNFEINGGKGYATKVPSDEPGKIIVDIIKPGEPIVTVPFTIQWETR